MIRRITSIALALLALNALAASRQRSVISVPADMQALAPVTVSGATVSGIVTAVNGTIISLAGGLVTIDASQAKITDERGTSGTIATVTPGSMILAVLNSSSVAPNAPLPAMIVAVARIPQVSLNGPVQSVGASSLTVLGRTVVVDANTSFGGRGRTLADILPNDVVDIHANNVSGVLLASSVLTFAPPPRPSLVIHGTVKSIGASSWVISDRAGKEWTILVNAQTKIAGDPRVGDTVDILVTTTSANEYVAVSIMKSIVVDPGGQLVFSGHVKTMGPTSWVITEAGRGHDVTVAVNSQTKIVGDPHVNDGVQVIASVDAAGNHTAVSIIKLGIVPPGRITLHGVVKDILALPCPATLCPESNWTIGPAAGLGPDTRFRANASTVIKGDPRIGDRVEAVVTSASVPGDGYIALSITKQ